ncbi:MAG: biotin carboxyl carrier domain-containing protein [Deltaproteobacteria bacterium]|nr:biotin carboxyl carrier domain-containing protein [Deltaproteobacteria bacterium]
MSSNNLYVVKAPLAGTFYESPSPDDPPYVEKGQKVKPGDVVCIVESMKVFTEIRAERGGTVKNILIEDEDPVNKGQILIEIELS